MLYLLAALVRIAFHGALLARQELDGRTCLGLPTEASAAVYPVLGLALRLLDHSLLRYVMPALLLVLAVLFLLPVRIRKPDIPALCGRICNPRVIAFVLFPLFILLASDAFFKLNYGRSGAASALLATVTGHFPAFLFLWAYIALAVYALYCIFGGSRGAKICALAVMVVFLVVNDIKFQIMGNPIQLSDVNYLNTDGFSMMGAAAGTIGPWIWKVLGKTLAVLLAIWSVSAIASLPGLAISPILGDLNKIFPKATDLEIQMLTSLPSLLIIPFVLLAGKLSVGRDKLKILAVGLSIFFLSGVACLFARSMMWLIVISCILGIGAGMVIPFSTGLVVDYFTGDYRVRQLGYSSSINNLTLVLATVVTGYLANVDWHLPFLVYTLPGISLALSFLLKRQRSVPEPEQSIQLRHKMIDRRKLAGLMAFYFFVTYAVLVVTFYASFLIDDYKIDSSFSGVLISLFFLAIMLPGLFIANIIRSLKRNVNLVALVLVCVGLLCVGVFHGKAMLAFGALCTGLGYGIMQPVIYDKAATIAPPRSATLALSFVMSVNYLAVMVCPFIVDLFRHVFGTHSDRFPFFFNAVLVLAVAVVTLLRRDSFTLGLDGSYYRN